jgi:GTP-binding protein Era
MALWSTTKTNDGDQQELQQQQQVSIVKGKFKGKTGIVINIEKGLYDVELQGGTPRYGIDNHGDQNPPIVTVRRASIEFVDGDGNRGGSGDDLHTDEVEAHLADADDDHSDKQPLTSKLKNKLKQLGIKPTDKQLLISKLKKNLKAVQTKPNDKQPLNSKIKKDLKKGDPRQKQKVKPTTKPSLNLPIEPVAPSGDVLFQQLDDIFDYKGRISSKLKGAPDFRCGFVSILGAPNMGKSSLLNALLKEDLCIATRRPQTTRHAILGVITTPKSQLCLIDTPGIIEDPAYKLQEGMMEAVKGAFTDSDALLVVTDLFSTPIPDDDIFQRLLKSKKPVIIAVNKIDLEGSAQRRDPIRFHNEDDENDDLVEDDKTFTVPEAVARWRSLVPDALAIIPLSASEGPENPGVNFLRQLLVGGTDIPASIRAMGRPLPGMFRDGVQFLNDDDAMALLPLGPPLYDEELLTDRPERFFVSELIRESLFECLNKELPYCCEVQVTMFKDVNPDSKDPIAKNRNKTMIGATIFVERDSQKAIVVGKGGEKIKEVGIMAREKVKKFLAREDDVFLELTVKVNKDWRKNEDVLKQLGYIKE